jgi:hydrogenase maturation protein HypF
MAESSPFSPAPSCLAQRITLTGKVQGVGFRPFVYRLARSMNIHGWVKNMKGNVRIHAEAPAEVLDRFIYALIDEAPKIARPVISHQEVAELESATDFTILASDEDADADIHIPTDYYTCPDCLLEMNDPQDRRFRYPFINCTQCGPRYTLIRSLPYDRANTSMAAFPLCPECRAEYEDPMNRRFHAEPVACPVCGPALRYVNQDREIAGNNEALSQAVAALKAGKTVAVKGVGGYHLLCDAENEQAVALLRARKHRPDKPLAVMFPATGKDELQALCVVAAISDDEALCLRSPGRPVVLVSRKEGAPLAEGIAPGLGEFGVFLPYSPLHYLLLQSFGGPLVATSANISGEPVLIAAREVEQRLGRVADAFLHHDRAIVRPADDSVFHFIGGLARPLRLGRGYAPTELALPFKLDAPMLAVGGQMKNTVALAWEDRLVISPHIGDLDSPRSLDVFENTINDLQKLYEVEWNVVACDAHPGYASHRWARKSGHEVIPIFHHHAHASSLSLEYPGDEAWLVFTWDGVGFGEDGSLWGGEALYGRAGSWERLASFKPFHIPGGDRAGREPWRSAAALCWQSGMSYEAPSGHELVRSAWEKRLNCPQTTAVGRLFDAAAALTGLNDRASFEGQGPMLLEASTDADNLSEALPFRNNDAGLIEADWSPLLPMLTDESRSVTERANQFHATMAATLIGQAVMIREQLGDFRIGLAGGVFQNKRLTEQVLNLGREHGFDLYLPQAIPCNDGGLSAGQIIEAAAILNKIDNKKE